MMDDGFYFDEFLDFADNFNRTLKEEQFIIDVLNKLGNIMIREVKSRTPVGKYDNTVFYTAFGPGGTRWIAHFEGPTTTRQGGHLRRNWKLDGVENVGDGYMVSISNNVEYASWVENGHRKADHSGWVEGQFFMKITMQEIEKQLPKIVGPEYKAYLRRFGLE